MALLDTGGIDQRGCNLQGATISTLQEDKTACRNLLHVPCDIRKTFILGIHKPVDIIYETTLKLALSDPSANDPQSESPSV